MPRLRILLLVPLLVLIAPGWGWAATGTDEVVRALRADPVFVQGGSGVPLDVERVRDTIRSGSEQIYVAALPARAWQAQAGANAAAKKTALLRLIRGPLGSDATVLLVFGDRTFQAGSGPDANARGVRGGEVIEELLVTDGGGDFDEANVTNLVVAFVSQVQTQGSSGDGSTTGGGAVDGGFDPGSFNPGAFEEPKQDSAVPEIVLGTILVGAVGGGTLLYVRSRRRRQRESEEARADLESLYDRLGSDVSTLSPGDDAVARQALADAAERYGSTGALMSKADTPGEWAAARRTAIEGLTAARVVRERLGLDPGPELPPPPSAGPVLTERQAVQIGDQQFEGSPAYEPGRQHWFGGGNLAGRYVPGGWYGFPFWETMLVTSVLTGGFGGGGGYDQGYQDGRDEAGDGGSDGGGDWGSGGGGFGGGDSGGGSWGGGDSGGGSSGGSGGDSGGGSW